MYKISLEQATQEFESYLDFLKVSPIKREEQKDSEKYIIEAIRTGRIEIDGDGVVKVNLLYPLEKLKQIEFSSRVSVRAVRMAFKNVDEKDSIGRIVALAAKVSKTPIAQNTKIWDEFDFKDLEIIGKIFNYFL